MIDDYFRKIRKNADFSKVIIYIFWLFVLPFFQKKCIKGKNKAKSRK